MTALDTAKIGRAFNLANELHADQVRKGTTIPYVSHLMAVAALVLEDDGCVDAVCAALLHDAIEDQGGLVAFKRIRDLLGDRVASLVLQCSDAAPELGEAKAPWRARKEAMLSRLPSLDADALLIIAADKLHNLRASLSDEHLSGESVWSRFRTGREGFVWYHRETAKALSELAPNSRSVRLLAHEVRGLDGADEQ